MPYGEVGAVIGRRNAVELIDPKTEDPILLCERCAGRAALGFLYQRKLPPVRRVHADDPALARRRLTRSAQPPACSRRRPWATFPLVWLVESRRPF